MIDVILDIADEIHESIIDFKQSNDKRININSLRKLLQQKSINIKSDEIRLRPDYYGYSTDHECPSLEWLAFIVLYHANGYKLKPSEFLLILSTINHHGLFGLLDLFENEGLIFFNTDQTERSLKQLFSYYQSVAKYYKGLGNFERAQNHYLKIMELGKKLDILPYAYSLQSKLNADYLLRKGMAKEYSKIAYKHAIEDPAFKEKFPRRYLICLDTYAKDIYLDNPVEGKSIYQQLVKLSKKYLTSLIRIEFRYLEVEIKNKIKQESYSKIPKLLKLYEEKLNELLENKPKAKYIRTLHFIGFFHELDIKTKIDDPWYEEKIESLKEGEAEYLIENCIKAAKSFRDRRFISLGYYELSHWLVRTNRLDDAIKSLKEGLKSFDVAEKSIINAIYIEIIKNLANLYGRKSEWENSLEYYNQLYSYLKYVTSELEEHKLNLEAYSQVSNKRNANHLIEFSYLNAEDRKNMYMSLLVDYDSLAKSLLDYGNEINKIQSVDIQEIKQIMHDQNHIIYHDLRKNFHILRVIKNELEAEVDNNNSKKIIKQKLKKLDREIASVESNIHNYEKTAGVTILNDIDLCNAANNYIDIKKTNYATDIDISYVKNHPIITKFSPFDLNELIENLLGNCYSTGTRNNVQPIKIEFELLENNNIAYLICSDNCGDFKFYSENVVKRLNANKGIKSKNKGGSGIGLTMLKKLLKKYKLTIDWKLTGDNNWKTLEIPLTKV